MYLQCKKRFYYAILCKLVFLSNHFDEFDLLQTSIIGLFEINDFEMCALLAINRIIFSIPLTSKENPSHLSHALLMHKELSCMSSRIVVASNA